MTHIQAGIWGIGAAIPERILTNQELETMVETSDAWIRSRTGIQERRIAAREHAASDLALEAAERALEDAAVSAGELDMIIVATITPDMAFPATACIVQDRLGASKASAFDLSAGCSGFVYALDVGANLVATGRARILVIGVDLLSRVTDYSDRSTCVLFGDGAAAAVLGPVGEGYGVVAAELGADGSGGDFLKLPAGGSRRPASHDTVKAGEHYLHMAGNEVFKFAVRIMGDSTTRVLKKAGLSPEAIRWFVPHQANIRIINASAQRLGIPDEKLYVNVQRYGNTSAASIGLALAELSDAGHLSEGDYVLIVGFGAGLTWGSMVIRWGRGES